MIKPIKKERPLKKIEPYYKLVFNYMIGDADGNMLETAKISENNIYLERFFDILSNLEKPKKYIGLMLTVEHITEVYDEKNINDSDYMFLMSMLFHVLTEDFNFIDEENESFSYEFLDSIFTDIKGIPLFLEELKLYHVNEYNEEIECYIEK